ncbi:MAG: TatD family hydrolase [Proteobacteria bacterium]|nr:TatD family hydrolase [Pseudomonadota bacterium]
MTSLVDSHCHINFDPLGQEVDQVISRAREAGVEHLLCVSVDIEDYPQVLALAREYDNVFASVGVHPNHQDCHEPTVEELVEQASTAEVVAIGETGLDYFRSEGDLEWQRDRFRRHIAAAKESGKPLIIHTREAAADTLKILKEENARDIGGVMHCFAEDWDVARKAMDLNFHISFSGIVTFKSAESLREVAMKVPADRMLVETDCPYLAPVPYRGKTNEPAFVRYVAECVADVRKENFDSIANATTDNFFRLFNSASR